MKLMLVEVVLARRQWRLPAWSHSLWLHRAGLKNGLRRLVAKVLQCQQLEGAVVVDPPFVEVVEVLMGLTLVAAARAAAKVVVANLH